MATRMTSSSTSKDSNRLTMWEVFERAAKRKYGNDITVVKAPWVTKQVNGLMFDISVVRVDSEPKEKRRTTADINMKEYVNPSDKAEDETIVRISKKRTESQGSRYKFSSTTGVNWGVNGNIGAQVMGLAMAGGSASIGASYSKNKSTTSENEHNEAKGFEFCYQQEEKISVQPHTRVTALITTYAMKYEQQYTIKLGLPKDLSLNLMYKNCCNRWCFGFGANWGRISASELLYDLPGYEEDEDTVSFLQDGILSWIGEGSKIDKTEEPLNRSVM